MRLVKKGYAKVPAKITLEDGLYQGIINGVPEGPAVADPLDSWSVMRIWETGRLIEQHVYDHAIALKAWAEKNDPTHPAANVRKALDLASAEPVYRSD